MAAKKKERGQKPEGKCAKCGKACDDDHYCHGCKKHICDDCSVNWNPPWGTHDVSVHFEEPEEDEAGYDRSE